MDERHDEVAVREPGRGDARPRRSATVGQGGFFGGRSARFCLALWLAGSIACRETVAPATQPPYLAVVAQVIGPEAAGGTRYDYHIKELSGYLSVDTVISVSPADTVILPLQPATYIVDLSGVPAHCHVRDGALRAVLIASGTNTTLLRYFISCQADLTVTVLADGAALDSEFVYRLAAADGTQRLGVLHARDTLVLGELPPGPAMFDLANIAVNCTVTSDGGAHRVVSVDTGGGAELDFRIVCSDPARRPSLVAVGASYQAGVAGLYVRGMAPDRALDRFSFDITDCNRTSVLATGARQRDHLATGRTAGQDTTIVVSAFEIGLADSLVHGRCAAVWVSDRDGNVSAVSEIPLNSGGTPPSAASFNAHFLGPATLRIELAAQDVDGDFVGTFVAFRLRDGVLGPSDGVPDIGYYNTAGFLGSAIPDLGLGSGGLTYDNFYAVVVYLIDARGNVTRLEDADLFQ